MDLDEVLTDLDVARLRGLIDCDWLARQLGPGYSPSPTDVLCGVLITGLAIVLDKEIALRANKKAGGA